MFARQEKPQRMSVDVNNLVTQSIELRSYDLRTSGIEVTTALASDLPSTVVDGLQLQQVFLNLVANAEAAMKEANDGGHLHVETGFAGEQIFVAFRDDGPGIPRELHDRIFEPFFTTKSAGKGTGLGLSICHGIVSEHGGRIELHSDEGSGAEFIVRLPILNTQGVPVAASEPSAPAAPVGRILVVDDEPSIRSYLRDLLQLDGHTVEIAGSGQEALAKLQGGRFHAILMDVRMPDMSGIELSEHLRGIAESMVRRVIFMTGDVMNAEIKRHSSERGIPVLPKPLDTGQLRSALVDVLSRRP
jgi:CheY-like chemotaxis protein